MVRRCCAFSVVFVACVSAHLSCALGPAEEGLADVDLRQASAGLTARPSKELWVVVVDDAPTAEGDALRAALAAELIGSLDRARSAGCPGELDFASPALDIQVLLIPSSNPERALHGGVRPELHLRQESPASEAGQFWEKGFARAILSLRADALGSNEMLAAASHWDDILLRRRAPRGDADEALLADLEPDRIVRMLFATTRDDAQSDFGRLPTFGSTAPINWELLVYEAASCEESDPERKVPKLAAWVMPTSTACGSSLFFRSADCDESGDCEPR